MSTWRPLPLTFAGTSMENHISWVSTVHKISSSRCTENQSIPIRPLMRYFWRNLARSRNITQLKNALAFRLWPNWTKSTQIRTSSSKKPFKPKTNPSSSKIPNNYSPSLTFKFAMNPTIFSNSSPKSKLSLIISLNPIIPTSTIPSLVGSINMQS